MNKVSEIKSDTFEGIYIKEILLNGCRVEGDKGAGTRENRGGRWAGSERRRSGMRESCEGGRRMRDIKFFNDFLDPF